MSDGGGTKRVYRLKPKHTVTAEAIAAFKAGDYTALHLCLGLMPWEINPLIVHTINEPARDTPNFYLQSWWRARRLRRELEAALTSAELETLLEAVAQDERDFDAS